MDIETLQVLYLRYEDRLRYRPTTTEARVIFVLAGRHPDVEDNPSVRELAKEVGRSEQYVRSSIRNLAHKGVIQRRFRPAKSSALDLTPLFRELEILDGRLPRPLRPCNDPSTWENGAILSSEDGELVQTFYCPDCRQSGGEVRLFFRLYEKSPSDICPTCGGKAMLS